MENQEAIEYLNNLAKGNYADVITLNDEKANLLKKVFEEMNEISFAKYEEG